MPEGVEVSSARLGGRGAGVWVALIVVVTAWELLALFSSQRDDHPTLSTITDRMSTHPGRTVVFVVWLSAGAALAWPRRQDGRV
jgi:hypothetical protein